MPRVSCSAPGCRWAHELADADIALAALHLHAQSHRPTEQDIDRAFAQATS